MCIICIKKRGVNPPSNKLIKTMFKNNPHGAGYMIARGDYVSISKGFMNVDDLLTALKSERITKDDAVVYHFRISTQAGVTPSMTQPFPYSHEEAHLKALDVRCKLGVAHNGIITLTTDYKQKELSDTALFIRDYLKYFITKKSDLKDAKRMELLHEVVSSKLAFLTADGDVFTCGEFNTWSGLLFSNYSYVEREPVKATTKVYNWHGKSYTYGALIDDYDDDCDGWTAPSTTYYGGGVK